MTTVETRKSGFNIGALVIAACDITYGCDGDILAHKGATGRITDADFDEYDSRYVYLVSWDFGDKFWCRFDEIELCESEE